MQGGSGYPELAGDFNVCSGGGNWGNRRRQIFRRRRGGGEHSLPIGNSERPLVAYPGKRPLIRLTTRPPDLENKIVDERLQLFGG